MQGVMSGTVFHGREARLPMHRGNACPRASAGTTAHASGSRIGASRTQGGDGAAWSKNFGDGVDADNAAVGVDGEHGRGELGRVQADHGGGAEGGVVHAWAEGRELHEVVRVVLCSPWEARSRGGRAQFGSCHTTVAKRGMKERATRSGCACVDEGSRMLCDRRRSFCSPCMGTKACFFYPFSVVRMWRGQAFQVV